MKIKSSSFPILLSFCMIFIIAMPAIAQETIEVKVEQAMMSKGMQTAYVVEMPMAVLKNVQQNWIKRLQENIKVKVVTLKDELVLEKVVKSEISTDTISIYSLIIENTDRIVMNVFVEIDSVFFSPTEDKANLSAGKTDSSIKNYIRKFAVEQYKLAAGSALAAEQKILEELENDLKKLLKDNENLKKDNSSQENNIEKTERQIKSLDQEIDMKNSEVMSHKMSMQGIMNEEAKKTAQEKDKALEKELNKLEKERSKAKDDISDMKSKIEKNNKSIKDNENDQVEKEEEINVQKGDVSKAQALLDGIK